MWVKKIDNIVHILSIIEDNSNYYVACELDDIDGELIALNRETGSTKWYIPGRPYLQQIFDRDIYAIFVDSEKCFYLLRITTDRGTSKWLHPVDSDLHEYSIRKDRITLSFLSGKTEELDARTGIALSGLK